MASGSYKKPPPPQPVFMSLAPENKMHVSYSQIGPSQSCYLHGIHYYLYTNYILVFLYIYYQRAKHATFSMCAHEFLINTIREKCSFIILHYGKDGPIHIFFPYIYCIILYTYHSCQSHTYLVPVHVEYKHL